MLSSLIIKNYALIEHLEMHPHESFNIITGETGAGKSIMLGAIGLLLGNRADLKVLSNPEEKCIVEADFTIWAYDLQPYFEEMEIDYHEQTNIRREIIPSGKSRAFINDTPVTLETLKAVTSKLLDVHSQHDNLLLGDNLFQIKVIDAYAQNKELLLKYKKQFAHYKLLKNQYEQLLSEYKSSKNELEYNQFLLDELQKAKLEDQEEPEKLEAEIKILDSTEEIKVKLNAALEGLSISENSINGNLGSVLAVMNQLSKFSDQYETLRSRIESSLIELKDITSELESEEERVEFNPQRLMEAQDRLNLIYRLQQKHGLQAIADLNRLKEELEVKVSKVLNFDEELALLKADLESVKEQMIDIGNELTEKRKAIFKDLENELIHILVDLGMPNANIQLVIQAVEPHTEGLDLINFLFSANKGVQPQAIEKIASGGEFSRLMLAIKYILAGKTALPTIIFDEIDTGISGEVALKMGKMMKEMSNKHQIIAISHLHQVAAKGDNHYFVYKDNSSERTISKIKKLNPEERIFEIAQMISGAQPSESAILSAKELLEIS